jgi:hypothetical protein
MVSALRTSSGFRASGLSDQTVLVETPVVKGEIDSPVELAKTSVIGNPDNPSATAEVRPEEKSSHSSSTEDQPRLSPHSEHPMPGNTTTPIEVTDEKNTPSVIGLEGITDPPQQSEPGTGSYGEKPQAPRLSEVPESIYGLAGDEQQGFLGGDEEEELESTLDEEMRRILADTSDEEEEGEGALRSQDEEEDLYGTQPAGLGII